MNRLLERIAPVGFGVAVLAAWQCAVWATGTPKYVVPGPWDIVTAYAASSGELNAALLSTLTVTFAALAAAAFLGVVLAVAMAASVLLRAAIQPWAVALQVTPLVAIAPLIILWVNQAFAALVICATIISFFPILANTAAGLAQTPAALLDLFKLNGASRWQTLLLLRLPSAVPNFLTGLRISGTLALVASPPASPTESWKRDTGWKFQRCSPPWCCWPWPAWRSTRRWGGLSIWCCGGASGKEARSYFFEKK